MHTAPGNPPPDVPIFFLLRIAISLQRFFSVFYLRNGVAFFFPSLEMTSQSAATEVGPLFSTILRTAPPFLLEINLYIRDRPSSDLGSVRAGCSPCTPLFFTSFFHPKYPFPLSSISHKQHLRGETLLSSSQAEYLAFL